MLFKKQLIAYFTLNTLKRRRWSLKISSLSSSLNMIFGIWLKRNIQIYLSMYLSNNFWNKRACMKSVESFMPIFWVVKMEQVWLTSHGRVLWNMTISFKRMTISSLVICLTLMWSPRHSVMLFPSLNATHLLRR